MTLAIIDFNRTLYNPDSEQLNPGAMELLSNLAKRGIDMVLVSRDEGGRQDLINVLGIVDFFDEVLFVDAKTPDLFSEIMRRRNASPASTFVLGDYIREEISAGNQVGAFTIRFKHGRFADMRPESQHDEADATIDNLKAAIDLI